jgi:hypothetical protein
MNDRNIKISSSERQRRQHLLSLWQQRPETKRTENDLPAFYRDMERAFPDLLSRRGGDAYQNLENDLDGYIEKPRNPRLPLSAGPVKE